VVARVSIRRVAVRDFRNLLALELEPAPRLNVIAGDNGQGKTSLLESIYFVATSKSFRSERSRELVREGAERAHVRCEIEEAGHTREQTAVITRTARSLLLDGKRAARMATYATRTPVVVFHPGDLTLVSGSASGRRRLLDRVALYLRPTSADARMRYERAMRERQQALETRGVAARDLDAYERLVATHGAELSRARSEAARELSRALSTAFQRMAPPNLALASEYRPAGTEDPAVFEAELTRLRPADMRRGAATFGPHRDDFHFDLEGRSAREHASQGQQRVLTLALKAAELAAVREVRGVEPILLLDDISSELDPSRTGAVYAFVRDLGSQVFVTTTRPELFVTPDVSPGDRSDWLMSKGGVSPLKTRAISGGF
jgi:DNA replication and repair protein RecF